MSAAFSTPSNSNKSFALLAICILLAIAAVAVGIDDNPPGILLAFLSAAAFVLAFVHPWRTAKKFMVLILASLLGFILFIILNIIFDAAAQNPAIPGALQDQLHSPVISTIGIIISMVCAAALLVGVVGAVAMFIRNRRQPA